MSAREVAERLDALWALLNNDGDEYGACDTLHEAAALLAEHEALLARVEGLESLLHECRHDVLGYLGMACIYNVDSLKEGRRALVQKIDAAIDAARQGA